MTNSSLFYFFGGFVKIYDFLNYKEFVQNWILLQPKKGHGSLNKIAKALGVHSTLISHIFNGDKELNLEQGLKLCKFLDLNKKESQFLILLIQYSRAGSDDLKKFLKEQIEVIQEDALELKNRLKTTGHFSEEDRGRFYSNWYYSAIRLATDIKNYRSSIEISKALNLPEDVVVKVLSFLTSTGLCVKKDQKYFIGPTATHVEAGSPFVTNHHRNWRLKAIERHLSLSSTELAFTSPLTMSETDCKLLKKKIINFIEDAQTLVAKSPPEELRCLNIDWIKII